MKTVKIGRMTYREIRITEMALVYYLMALKRNGRLKTVGTAEKLRDRFDNMIAKIEKEGSEKKNEM